MYQQLRGYKVEEKLYLGVREQKRLNTTDLDYFLIIVLSVYFGILFLCSDSTFWPPHITRFVRIKYQRVILQGNINIEAQNLLGCTAVFLIECRPTFQLRKQQYVPEDSELHTRRRENLKSHNINIACFSNTHFVF
jgi:hypothetical protein